MRPGKLDKLVKLEQMTHHEHKQYHGWSMHFSFKVILKSCAVIVNRLSFVISGRRCFTTLPLQVRHTPISSAAALPGSRSKLSFWHTSQRAAM